MKKLFFNKNLGLNSHKKTEHTVYQHSMFGYLLSVAIVAGSYYFFEYNFVAFLIGCLAAIVVFPYTSDKILEITNLKSIDRGATQAIRFIVALVLIFAAVYIYYEL